VQPARKQAAREHPQLVAGLEQPAAASVVAFDDRPRRVEKRRDGRRRVGVIPSEVGVAERASRSDAGGVSGVVLDGGQVGIVDTRLARRKLPWRAIS
jgi:hypothetical protein